LLDAFSAVLSEVLLFVDGFCFGVDVAMDDSWLC
jgi:hypothetical protein